MSDISGPSGPSGPAGVSGPSGAPSNISGPAGPSGPTGAQGYTGPSGPQGATGNQGPSGPSGSQGIQGPIGNQGPSGPSGPSGPRGVGVPIGGNTGQVLAKASSADSDTVWTTGGLSNRTFKTGSTASLSNNTTASITISVAKSYVLLAVQTNVAAWVRLYTDPSSLSADSSRAQGTDPTPGTGIIAEVITTGATTQLVTPGAFGFNYDSPPTQNVYASITNISGSVNVVTIGLNVLPLE
jgi:hypothetical protein